MRERAGFQTAQRVFRPWVKTATRESSITPSRSGMDKTGLISGPLPKIEPINQGGQHGRS